MKKTLQFDTSDLSARRFQHLYDGVIIGGSRGQTQSKDETRREAGIQLKLEAISAPTPKDAIDLRFRPETGRTLNPAGGTAVFDIAELECIEKLVAAVPWGGPQKIAVADLYDFLSTAPVAEA